MRKVCYILSWAVMSSCAPLAPSEFERSVVAADAPIEVTLRPVNSLPNVEIGKNGNSGGLLQDRAVPQCQGGGTPGQKASLEEPRQLFVTADRAAAGNVYPNQDLVRHDEHVIDDPTSKLNIVTGLALSAPFSKAERASALITRGPAMSRLDNDPPYRCTARHRSHGFQNAYDIALPFGSELVAVADMKVLRVVEHIPDNWSPGRRSALYSWPESQCGRKGDPTYRNTYCGNCGLGNFVTVEMKLPSPNGPRYAYATYQHLKQNSVTEMGVREGDTLRRGDPIARSGNNGSTTNPHLHLQFARTLHRTKVSTANCQYAYAHLSQAPDLSFGSYLTRPTSGAEYRDSMLGYNREREIHRDLIQALINWIDAAAGKSVLPQERLPWYLRYTDNETCVIGESVEGSIATEQCVAPFGGGDGQDGDVDIQISGMEAISGDVEIFSDFNFTATLRNAAERDYVGKMRVDVTLHDGLRDGGLGEVVSSGSADFEVGIPWGGNRSYEIGFVDSFNVPGRFVLKVEFTPLDGSLRYPDRPAYALIGPLFVIQEPININGTDGDDTLRAHRYYESSIDGKGGRDTIYDSEYPSLLLGGRGGDIFIIEHGDARVRGGYDDDTVEVRGSSLLGETFLDGDEGYDTLDFQALDDSIFLSLGLDDYQNVGPGRIRMRDFEEVIGTDFDDYILGSANDDVIRVGRGQDYGNGRGGNDTVVSLADDNGPYVDVQLVGEDGDDVLILVSGRGEINGGPGNDTLIGGTGDDFLAGGGGFDLIKGGEGDDIIIGGDEGSRIEPGPGDDRITGGLGPRYIFLEGESGTDTITRFDSGDDVLSLDQVDPYTSWEEFAPRVVYFNDGSAQIEVDESSIVVIGYAPVTLKPSDFRFGETHPDGPGPFLRPKDLTTPYK